MNGNAYLNAGEFKPVRLADIIVPAYQREGTERSANNVATNFDPQLLQAITLVEIDEPDLLEDDRFLVEDDVYHRTGKLYLLVDGLQRCTGLAQTHESDAEVMAQVFKDVYRDRQVDLFVGLNRGSVRVKDYWIYRAKLNSGHPGIIAIDKELREAGFKTVAKADKNNRSTVPGIDRLTRFCGVSLASSKRDGANDDSLQALSDALYVINAVWPADMESSAQRTNTSVLFGLATLFRDSRSRGGRTLERDYVIEKVRTYASQLIAPGNLIAEGNRFKAKDTAGLTSSGGSNSGLKFTIQAWLLVINKGSRTKFALPTKSEE